MSDQVAFIIVPILCVFCLWGASQMQKDWEVCTKQRPRQQSARMQSPKDREIRRIAKKFRIPVRFVRDAWDDIYFSQEAMGY